MTNRIRYVSPDRFLDEDFADLPDAVQVFLLGLPTHCDRAGRTEDRPNKLKAQIRPYDPKFDPEEALAILARPRRIRKLPWIIRYQVGDERFIQIVDWETDQTPHHTERQSKIPPLSESTVKAPLCNGSLTGRNGDGDGEWNGDGNGECEGKGEVDPPAPLQGSGSSIAEPPSPDQPVHPERVAGIVSQIGSTLGGYRKPKPGEFIGEKELEKAMSALSGRRQ